MRVWVSIGVCVRIVIPSDEHSEESRDLLFCLRDSGAGQNGHNPSASGAKKDGPRFQPWVE
jgi:hypothetical protein